MEQKDNRISWFGQNSKDGGCWLRRNVRQCVNNYSPRNEIVQRTSLPIRKQDEEFAPKPNILDHLQGLIPRRSKLDLTLGPLHKRKCGYRDFAMRNKGNSKATDINSCAEVRQIR